MFGETKANVEKVAQRFRTKMREKYGEAFNG